MNVVVVGGALPFPANTGSRIRTLNLLTRLARRHRITLVGTRNPDPRAGRAAVEYLDDHGIKAVEVEHVVPSKSGPGFYARLAANLASPLPYSVASHIGPALVSAVRRLAAHGDVDLWQAEWSGAVEAWRGMRGAKTLVMAPNVETQIWERTGANEANLARRWYARGQARKFARFERRAFAEANRVVTVSEEDAALVRERFGVPSARVDVVDNGIDRAFFESVVPDRDPRRIVFLGSLDWRPNLDALGVLLDRIFPIVCAAEPAATLDIVGRNPPARFADASRGRNAGRHAACRRSRRPALAGARVGDGRAFADRRRLALEDPRSARDGLAGRLDALRRGGPAPR